MKVKKRNAQTFLRGVAKVLDRVEKANQHVQEDPLGFVDAVLGQTREKAATGAWWELFGMDEKPTAKADLERAWKQWAKRNHPDVGGSDPAFRYMHSLYETHLERL